MDAERRRILMSEYEDAQREREQLDAYIDVLAKRLGIAEGAPGDPGADGPFGPQALGGVLTNDVMSLVYANEFVGKSMPKAAEIVLRRWSPTGYTRPLKTTDLLRALRQGGLNIDNSRALYRALYGSSRFHGLKGGNWGLREWYPESVRRAAKNDDVDTDEPTGAEVSDFPAEHTAGDSDSGEEVAAS